MMVNSMDKSVIIKITGVIRGWELLHNQNSIACRSTSRYRSGLRDVGVNIICMYVCIDLSMLLSNQW